MTKDETMREWFYEMTGRKLSEFEEYFNFKNDEGEWCYDILDRYTGEILETNAY